MTDLNQTLVEPPEENIQIKEATTENEEEVGYPCEQCDKTFPNMKAGKDLHMQRVHNIKSLQSTPGPPRRSQNENSQIITRPPIKCTLCDYVCKSKPTMKKHIEFIHKSKTAVEKQEPKKRPRASFICPACDSTFDSRYHMKNHVKKQHEDKDILSPQRKAAKTQLEGDKSATNIINEEEVTLGRNKEQNDMVTIEKEEFENLHDLLLQTGKDKETLADRIIEWKNYSEQIIDKLKSAENVKTEVENKLDHLKALTNTSILGLATPIENEAGKFKYDCTLCEQKNMNQNDLFNHLNQIHNILRQFEHIPVIDEDNQEMEDRLVVTTKEAPLTNPTTPDNASENKINILKEQLTESNRRQQLFEKENSDLAKDNKFFKEEAAKLFSKAGEYWQVIAERDSEINYLKIELNSYKVPKPTTVSTLINPNITSSNPTILSETRTPQQEPPQLQVQAEAPQDQAQAPQEHQALQAQGLSPLWRPFSPTPVNEVDECIQNVRCQGNCTHMICNDTAISQKLVTCNDCKEKFQTKDAMMDHKRDSDHPSKRKCNQDPDCERGARCWYVHRTPASAQTLRAGQQEEMLTCTTCHYNFRSRNELMMHKKTEHLGNNTCRAFLAGYCRRGAQHCWNRHDATPTLAPNVVRNQILLPPPGSTSWDQDFPQHPTMGPSPLVGLHQQLWAMMHQQKQQQTKQQQEHQQQMAAMMSQLMNLNM